jgi:hypothetical protein
LRGLVALGFLMKIAVVDAASLAVQAPVVAPGLPQSNAVFRVTPSVGQFLIRPQVGGGFQLQPLIPAVAVPAVPATVTVIASDPDAAEPGANIGAFTITRTGGISLPLPVSFVLGGTANQGGLGADYVAINSPITIPAGASNVTVLVTPVDDGLTEFSETVTLTLVGGPNYNVGAPANATVTIFDDDVGPPVITGEPQSQRVSVGASVSFMVMASGALPLTFQWRLNGIDIPGATGATYLIPSASVTNGGTYTVVVANSFGAVVSPAAVLTFDNIDDSPHQSDSFPNPLSLSGMINRVQGTNCGATKQLGEPNHAGRPGGSSVWYKWTAPDTGIATFYTSGSTFDTLLAVYTGMEVNALTLIAGNDDRGGFFTSKVQFNATNGVEYHIAIDGIGGNCGIFLLNWELEPTPDTLPEITMQPRSQTVPFGDTVVFTVVAPDAFGGYQWFHNGAAVTAATEHTLTLVNVHIADLGAYAVRVINAAGRTRDSDLAYLEIGPDPCVRTRDKAEDLLLPNGLCGSEQIGDDAFFRPATAGGSFGGFSVTAGTIINHHFSNASNTGSNEVNGCNIVGGASAWCVITNVATEGLLTIDTIGSQIDTVMQVEQWEDSLAKWVRKQCTNDIIAGINLQSRISFQTQPRSFYRVYVDGVYMAGVGPDRGHVRFNIHQGLTNLAESTFDRDINNWGTTASPGLGITWKTATNGGGHLQATGNCPTSSGWRWQAPSSFHNDKSAAFGGVLEFDLRQSAISGPTSDDIILAGGNITLTYQLDSRNRPGTNWTYYRIPLCPNGWWNKSTGQPPSQSEMLQVLANLSRLEILGQYSAESCTNELDNVALFGPETPLPRLTISLVSRNAVLRWPASGKGFILESTNLLTQSTSAWQQVLQTPTVSNGTNTVIIPLSNRVQFFQLNRSSCP